MKLSIVVVTYRRPDYLPATLDSLLGQSYEDFELLISDDASGDSTLDIAHAYAAADDRVRVRSNTRNLGMPDNLNAALRECRGEYVVNCHDGDLYAADLMEKWVELMDEDPRIGFSCCNWHQMLNFEDFPQDIFEGQPSLPRIMAGSEFLLDRFFTWKNPHFGSWVWGTAIMRRSVIQKLGYFDPRYGFYSDVDMWMRIALSHNVGVLRGVRIFLPPRKAVPNLFSRTRADRTVREIFLKNRVALCRSGRANLAHQLFMHYTLAAVQNLRLSGSAFKRRMLRAPQVPKETL